ncbi:MAG: hypothetical protein IKO19_13585 [Candidatus Riflebacteria bacterium]|nr:hypothetical protein [Candidatus Riflebacteria bacterium]MBR4571685.1 hypothetical protein [Candidatus Riflebacteria bacterium]
MNKKLMFSIMAMLIAAGSAHAVDLNEIQKLKEMGFTNEQIVEMTKSQNGNNAAGSQANAVSEDKIVRINSAKANHKGILVICASKEYPDRGPGYLDIFKDKEKIGSVELSEYVSSGPAMQSKTNYFEYSKKNKGTSGTSTTTVANNICSRYIGTFELPAGTYEIKLERSLYMGDPTSALRFKNKMHKIFHKVTIEEGKATMLSYYWEANENFGKDVVMSGNHKDIAGKISTSWGEYLSKVMEK